MFATSVPGLNFEGKSHIRTSIGAFFTLIVLTLTLAVATSRTITLVRKENFVTHIKKKPGEFLSSNNTLNLSEFDFMVAFEVTDYGSGLPKDDPNIVKWLGEIIESDGRGKMNRTFIETHKCTPDDKKKFFPPSLESRGVFERFINTTSFFCLNHSFMEGRMK